MENPVDAFLPAVFDPLLNFLSENLPDPLYTIFVKVLSHAFAAFVALITLGNSLLANAPETWNAQAILPPVITILAAYLALSSFYRTTSWMLRTTFWFMKWGTLFGIFLGGMGFLLGGGGGNGVGHQGGMPGVGDILASLLAGPRRNTNGRLKRTRNRNQAKRPKPWESFERHDEWQYQEVNKEDITNEQGQRIISSMADAAGNLLRGNWMDVVKNIVGNDEEGPEVAPKLSRTSPKSNKKGASRSR